MSDWLDVVVMWPLCGLSRIELSHFFFLHLIFFVCKLVNGHQIAMNRKRSRTAHIGWIFWPLFFHIYSIENKSCIGFCYWSKLLWNKKYPFTSCKFWAAILLEMLKRNAEWRPTTDHVNRQNKLCCYYISTSLPSFFLSLSVPPPPLSMCYCCSLLLVAVAIVLRIRILVIFEVKSRIKLNLEAFCWWCCWCGCLTTLWSDLLR